MIQLRSDYQLPLKNKILEAWRRVRSVLAVCPTGGGKTVIFSSIIHDHIGAAAAVVHRKEIVGQISLSLAALGVKHRIVAPAKVVRTIRKKHLKKFDKSFIDQHAPCGVMSVQTLTSKSSENNAVLKAWLKQITLCVFDEGHHYVKQGLWAKAVEYVERAKLLLVSATPKRADGRGLGSHADGFVDEMVEGPSTAWLIEHGYLSGFTYKAPETDLNVADLAVTKSGDFNAKAFRARVVESSIVGDVVAHYQTHADGMRAIVFATDVETAEDMATAFREAGYSAAALSGSTDDGVRDRELENFENGKTQILVNVDLFDEGFDVPAVECVIMARPTKSLAKFLQMIGRGLRVVYASDYDLTTKAGRLAAIAAGSKPRAVVLDLVRNWENLGMPDWPRVWSLDSVDKCSRESGDDMVAQRVCVACTGPYEAFYKACPYCGHAPVPAGRSKPEQVEGDLLELDVAAMAALFRKMERADMSDEDYREDQFARRVPAAGRPAGMKRHRAAKYRRQVLRELVGWWVGMQPGNREQGEIYRRFYHRFGIDIASAFTLDTKDTNALIGRIQRGFHYDIA